MAQSGNIRKKVGILEVKDNLILNDSKSLRLGTDSTDGFNMSFDGADTLNIDAVTANDAVRVGESVLTDFQADGAGSDLLWDASANSLTNGSGIHGLFAPIAAIESISAQADNVSVSLTTTLSSVTSGASTTDTLYVPDATAVGHVKAIYLEADGGDDVTITPSSYADGTTFTLAAVGEFVVFGWNGSSWATLLQNGGTIA